MNREPLRPSLRFKVLERDSYRCRYCGATPESAELHVDHVHPVSEGGGNELENLVTSCRSCNLGKGAKVLDETPMTAEEKEHAHELLVEGASKVYELWQDILPDEQLNIVMECRLFNDCQEIGWENVFRMLEIALHVVGSRRQFRAEIATAAYLAICRYKEQDATGTFLR